MSMPTEAVEALHTITADLKAEHERMLQWLSHHGQTGGSIATLEVTRAEAERIFADRIAAHEANLKDLGWERKIRVELGQTGTQPGSSGMTGPAINAT